MSTLADQVEEIVVKFLNTDCVVAILTSHDMEDAIRECVTELARGDFVDLRDVDSMIRQFMLREEKGTSCLGGGIAVPHLRHPAVVEVVVAVGVASHAIEFKSLDGKPVDLVFLVMAPPDRPKDVYRFLSPLGIAIRDQGFPDLLRRCGCERDILDLLSETSVQVVGRRMGLDTP